MKCIDLFAGSGGFTCGAALAGHDVIWAANHWPAAVEAHAANHPSAVHACQDLHQQDWTQVPTHDLLLASPACQGHSRARGKDRPHHDACRSTAWAVVSAIECHRPRLAVVENVPEFTRWVLFPAWCQSLQALGYAVSPHLVDAADHGVPQNRRRVFMAITRSQAPIRLELPRRESLPASSFIRFDAGRWSAVNRPGRSPKTLARIRRGREQHGHRFLAPYFGSGSGLTGRSLNRPIGTITTRDRWSVIDGDRMRMLSVPEARAAMGFPEYYHLPANKRQAMMMLGNAVCPPAAADFITALEAAA